MRTISARQCPSTCLTLFIRLFTFCSFHFFSFSVRRSSLLFRLCILFLVQVPRFNSVRFLIVDDPLSVGLTQFLCPDFWASPPLLLPSLLDVQHAVGVATPPCPLPRGGWDAKERIGQVKKKKKEKGKIRVCIARNQLSSGNCWGVLVPDDRPDSTPPHTHTARARPFIKESQSKQTTHSCCLPLEIIGKLAVLVLRRCVQ